MRNVIRHLMGKPVQLSPKQEEKMARMQARADAQIAEANAQLRAAGIDPGQPMPSIRDVLKQSVEGFKDAVGEMFDDRRDVLDPGDADLNRPIGEVEDPTRRAEIVRAEHEARDDARASFRPA